ncbi:crossover junction endodeoxyribonuclease RuvC [Thiolapillus sp.]
MRILGIDPGSRVTGFGVIDSDGRQSRHVFSGCIRTSSKDFSARLGEIFNGIQQVLQDHGPEQVAVEQVFMAANAASALKLGHARGAAITAAVVAQLPVHEYTPRAVKLALVGTGAAEKEQVQHMIRLILGLQQPMGLDESDALAVALCHAHTHVNAQKLRGQS